MINHYTLIIGSQKCGTTSLFNYLAQHPQIAPSSRKETNFFANDEDWERGLAWYQSLWQWDPEVHRTALEASPLYTFSQSTSAKATRRIASVDAQFKFIFIMRDPIEKIDSARYQGYYQGWLKPSETDEVPPRLIESAQYAKQLDEYAQQFGKDSLLLLRLSVLKHEPQACLQQVCNFLELQPHQFAALEKIHNARNSYREDTPWRKLSQISLLKSAADLVPDRYKNHLRQLLSQPGRSKKDEVPALTEAQRRSIQQALRPDLQRLRQEYGVDIFEWDIGWSE